ncbi:MAG: twin-arginine translocation signal domain-containing protein [Tannerella sp.]|jgi:hypothetical protein|nr:twin-arginine translocation signal domain-containing protein [Tannerella sp.]
MTNRRDFIKQSSATVAGGFPGGSLFSACQKWTKIHTWLPEN